jgi:hypothetical protein
MVDRSLSPPQVTDADKPLRRGVTMAYRTALEAGRSHHAALDAARTVYAQARPEAMGDPLAASARITITVTVHSIGASNDWPRQRN